jgi:hypothetical protein
MVLQNIWPLFAGGKNYGKRGKINYVNPAQALFTVL